MSNIVRVDKLRSVVFSDITSNYLELGVPFSHAMRIVHFINATDQGVLISFDALNDNIFIPAQGFCLYDFTSNEDTEESMRFQNLTQVYLKYASAPSSGNVYLICTYGVGE